MTGFLSRLAARSMAVQTPIVPLARTRFESPSALDQGDPWALPLAEPASHPEPALGSSAVTRSNPAEPSSVPRGKDLGSISGPDRPRYPRSTQPGPNEAGPVEDVPAAGHAGLLRPRTLPPVALGPVFPPAAPRPTASPDAAEAPSGPPAEALRPRAHAHQFHPAGPVGRGIVDPGAATIARSRLGQVQARELDVQHLRHDEPRPRPTPTLVAPRPIPTGLPPVDRFGGRAAGIGPVGSGRDPREVGAFAPEPGPTIEVSIGRIEVRAAPSTPSVPADRAKPRVMTLEEYLHKRGGGGS